MAFTYSWSSIADSAIDPDSPIDTALMTAIRNNLVYLYEYIGGQDYTPAEPHTHDGVNSAPVNVASESQLSSSVVSQAKLKSATGEVSGAGPYLVLAGGEYGFFPQLRNTAGTDVTCELRTDSTSYVTSVRLGAASGTPHARQRYVQSSPPWMPYRDNDAVPIFVFALIDRTTGAIVATWTAEDPPWGNNGPTILNPFGRLMQLAGLSVPQLSDREAQEIAWADFDAWLTDPANAPQIAQAMAQRFTQEEKNADMALIPHPFPGYDATRFALTVLNPTDCRTCRAFRARHKYSGDSIAEILHRDYMVIDNDPIPDLRCPGGVVPVRARLRLTR